MGIPQWRCIAHGRQSVALKFFTKIARASGYLIKRFSQIRGEFLTGQVEDAMSNGSMFERVFGVSEMPWVIRVYLLLFAIFALLLIVMVLRPFGAIASPVDEQLSTKVVELASDGLKTVLGALLGSLSLAAEETWRQKPAKK
jgi:hypothetical protein